ncbi:MAG: serine O-acetyltransferase [marine bacterium B5-7]|nr:MAG: serine O-acetyltransferase [marine bacterium B5-7]
MNEHQTNKLLRVHEDSDPTWEEIRRETELQIASEPLLASFLHAVVLRHDTLEESLSLHLAQKLGSPALGDVFIKEILQEGLTSAKAVGLAIRNDLEAIRERDPACDRYSLPFLYFKGFQAIQTYRAAHFLWQQGRRELALFLQNRSSEVFAVDIHPAAIIGSGILVDHATGLVIGETAVVGDNVSMLHEVTLGGTGKDCGDRHPKVASGVLIGAGAKILGNVSIGENAKIGAGSVVLEDVPAHCTVAGVPAKRVGRCGGQPALNMDHRIARDTDEGDLTDEISTDKT